MHKHDHEVCDHCLHYCPVCGIVYCCKCDEEWGKTVYQGYPFVDPYYPYDTSSTIIDYNTYTNVTNTSGRTHSHIH